MGATCSGRKAGFLELFNCSLKWSFVFPPMFALMFVLLSSSSDAAILPGPTRLKKKMTTGQRAN